MERVLQTRQYVFTITWDEEARVWVTFVPDLNNLSTFGETRAEAIAHTHEAIESYLEAARSKETIDDCDHSAPCSPARYTTLIERKHYS